MHMYTYICIYIYIHTHTFAIFMSFISRFDIYIYIYNHIYSIVYMYMGVSVRVCLFVFKPAKHIEAGRGEIVTISPTTFSNAFSWMKMYEFRLRFHWKLFLSFELTILQHMFRKWLDAWSAPSHYLYQWWLAYWRVSRVSPSVEPPQ